MTGIAADIEHRAGAQRLHGPVDEFLLMLPFLVAIVIRGGLVIAPSRIASLLVPAHAVLYGSLSSFAAEPRPRFPAPARSLGGAPASPLAVSRTGKEG